MLATVGVILVVLGVVAAAAASGRPITAHQASAAMAYVPASGGRVVQQNADGTDTVAEYYSTAGGQAWQSGPAAFACGATYEELISTTWVRVKELTADARGRVRGRAGRLLAATQAGLELRTGVEGTESVSFKPGLPVLPAGVRDGQEWTAAGEATLAKGRTPVAIQPYAAKLRAAARNDGCITVTSELTVGAAGTPVRESSTWCLGRGVVATDARGTDAVAVERAPRWQSLGRVVANDPPDLSGRWNFTRGNLNAPPAALYATVRPVVLPGPVVVYVNSPGGDLVARGWTDGETDPRWSAHPGGQVTSVEAIGRVVVAATTERTMVAYGDQGEFLWQAALDDVSAVPIVRFGDLAVVAGLDGAVTAFQAETGTVAWRAQLPTEIRRPMVTDGTTLSVLDQTGNLLTLDAEGRTVHEFETVPPEAFTVTDDVGVVASRGDSYIRGYRLTDGELLWRIHVPGLKRSMDAIGGTVVVGRTDALLGLRAADGVQLWSSPVFPARVLVQGDRLVVADRTTLRLLDAAGTELGAFTTQERDLSFGSGVFLVAAADELFAFFGQYAYRREAR